MHKLKHLLLLLTILLLGSCNAQNKTELTNDDQELLLSGNWKFNTIYGMGSNPLNIQEQASDIVIDNDDNKRVEIKGNWSVKAEGQRGSTFHGKDYIAHNFKKDEAANNYVRFKPSIQKTGYYEAFVKFPFAMHLTAQVNVKYSNGKASKHFGQRSNCDQWMSLGIYKFNASEKNYIEVTAITESEVAADAVLFRPVSEAKYLEAKNQPNQVYKSNFDDANWHNLKVPGHWGMLNAYSNYNGLGWYRKEFELPTNWETNKPEKYRLKFDGVYHVAKVYLNGKYLGRHQGGFTPFEFEVGEHLNFNKSNLLAVEVDNNFMVGATWNWGGIIRDVHLVKNNEVRIKNQYIHATPDLEKGTATLKLKVQIENNSNKTQQIVVNSKVTFNTQIVSFGKTLEALPNKISEIYLDANLKATDVHLWHFDSPNLYQIETSISADEKEIDYRKDNFGIRKIEVTDSNLILNGEPVRLGGFNRVSEHRYWGSSEPIKLLEKDVDLMKEAGANFMRIMHGTQNEKLIALCDQKGILLFEEVNVRELTNPEFTPPEYPLAKHWIQGMVERDWNHPSVIGWSVGNELSDHYDYAKSTMDYVRKIDPYRLVTCVSNSGWKKTATRETDPNTEVDIIMHNMYRFQGDPQVIIDKLRSEWPEKPIFISEYGFDPYPTTSLDGDQQIVSDWNKYWRGKNEFVVGGSLWTFNDYRSGYAATSQEENRVWGLINAWRQKRRLFDRVAKEFSPIKDIEVNHLDISKNKAAITIPIRGLDDYPSYTLKDYKLKWNFRNSNGDIIEENSQKLPTIHPSDKTWNGTITWAKLLKELLDLRIQLVSPTGYVRYEKIIALSIPKSPVITDALQGDKSVRILFNKVVGATEYFVRYTNATGETIDSFKTISNAIEIEGLKNNKEYTFKVIAINDKGESLAPNVIKAQPNGKLVAPKIWDVFITDNKVIIGYTSKFGDDQYNIRYGISRDSLDKKFKSNVRGMMTIDLENEDVIYLQIQRENKGRISNWSNIIKAKKIKYN